MNPPISGIYVPHIVPYDATGKINEGELRSIINWLGEKGITGYYPNGSMGEFIRLSYEERKRVVKIVSEEANGKPILAGADGFTCAKISEALALLPSGVRRIFLAHSISSRNKMPALKQLVGALDELIIAGTSVQQIEVLSQLLEEIDLKLPCLLSLDSGLGREGARTIDELQRMKAVVDRSTSLNYRGLYTHEGFTYTSQPEVIEAQSRKTADLLRKAREELGGEGELWPGCSVTARFMAGESGVTGIRPGAYLLGDLSLTRCTGAMNWDDLAVAVVTTVIDKPEPGLALIDAGTKVFSSDRFPDLPLALPYNNENYALTRMSEEYGFLTGDDVDKLSIGEVILLVPTHICPVVNLIDQYSTRINGQLTTIPVTARGCV